LERRRSRIVERTQLALWVLLDVNWNASYDCLTGLSCGRPRLPPFQDALSARFLDSRGDFILHCLRFLQNDMEDALDHWFCCQEISSRNGCRISLRRNRRVGRRGKDWRRERGGQDLGKCSIYHGQFTCFANLGVASKLGIGLGTLGKSNGIGEGMDEVGQRRTMNWSDELWIGAC